MPGHPKRYYGAQQLHFINCSCYHRQPWLARPERRDLFLKVLEQVRRRYGFVVVGYVVMPDHIRLLISEPERGNPSRVMQAVKQGFARRVLKVLRRGRAVGPRGISSSRGRSYTRSRSITSLPPQPGSFICLESRLPR